MHDSNSVSVPVHKRNEFTNDDLYGGNEPARTWYNAMGPIASNFGPITLPPLDQKYVRGSAGDQVPDVVGMTESAATSLLQNAGFKVDGLPHVKSERERDSNRDSSVGSGTSGLHHHPVHK